MSVVNSNPSVTAASGRAANMSHKHAASAETKTPESRVQTANDVSDVKSDGAVINVMDEMIMDVDSYKEVLDKRLDTLAESMSMLDQGVARLKAMTDEIVRADFEPSVAQEDKNLIKEIYEELFSELNDRGPRKVVDIHGNILPQRAAALLKG